MMLASVSMTSSQWMKKVMNVNESVQERPRQLASSVFIMIGKEQAQEKGRNWSRGAARHLVIWLEVGGSSEITVK